MISYQISTFIGNATLKIDVSDPNELGLIIYQGDEEVVKLIRSNLRTSYGAFGHLIGDRTTPIDLDAALKQPPFTAQYNIKLTAGSQIVTEYNPGIPREAQT